MRFRVQGCIALNLKPKNIELVKARLNKIKCLSLEP